MNKNLKLNGEYILLQIENDIEKSGFILPDNMKNNNKVKKGKVIIVGDGINPNSKDEYKISCKINDIVLFFTYSGQEIILWKEKYILIKNSEIIGIISNNSETIFK